MRRKKLLIGRTAKSLVETVRFLTTPGRRCKQPDAMLTIKKGGLFHSSFLCALVSSLFLCGCAETGPHALFEGERLINEGKYTEAAVKLQKAVELLPRNAQAWNHLALAYHYAGKAADAATAYKHALELDRNLAVVHLNLCCL